MRVGAKTNPLISRMSFVHSSIGKSTNLLLYATYADYIAYFILQYNNSREYTVRIAIEIDNAYFHFV